MWQPYELTRAIAYLQGSYYRARLDRRHAKRLIGSGLIGFGVLVMTWLVLGSVVAREVLTLLSYRCDRIDDSLQQLVCAIANERRVGFLRYSAALPAVCAAWAAGNQLMADYTGDENYMAQLGYTRRRNSALTALAVTLFVWMIVVCASVAFGV